MNPDEMRAFPAWLNSNRSLTHQFPSDILLKVAVVCIWLDKSETASVNTKLLACFKIYPYMPPFNMSCHRDNSDFPGMAPPFWAILLEQVFSSPWKVWIHSQLTLLHSIRISKWLLCFSLLSEVGDNSTGPAHNMLTPVLAYLNLSRPSWPTF